jgi:hypothetical protein
VNELCRLPSLCRQALQRAPFIIAAPFSAITIIGAFVFRATS